MIYQVTRSGFKLVAGVTSSGNFLDERRGARRPAYASRRRPRVARIAHRELMGYDPVRGLSYLGLGDLGMNAGQGVQAAAPVAGAITSSIVATTSIASWAGPIGAGVGLLIGIIGSLFAAHAARAAGAKNENEAVNAYLPAFDQALQTIFQQANAGQISVADAISACQSVMAQWWQNMAPYQTGPGRSDCSHGGTNCGCSDPYCKNKACTAGCCVGCFALMPSIQNCIAAFSSPTGGSAQILQVYGSGYGAKARSAYTLTYTPPTASAALNSLTGTVGNTGIPTWLLLAAAGAAVYSLA